MAVDGLFKEFGEAFGRLFDHRPVLQGEISFYQREFEEKRGNREEIRLHKSLEYGREINEKLIPQIISQLQTNFPKFLATASEAVDLSHCILDKESKSGKNEWFEQQQLQRSEELSSFLEKIAQRVCDIDKEVMAEVALVETHYKELEEKLKITERKEKQVFQSDHEHAPQVASDEILEEKDAASGTGIWNTSDKSVTSEKRPGIDEVKVTPKDVLEIDCENKEKVEQNGKVNVDLERTEVIEEDRVEVNQ